MHGRIQLGAQASQPGPTLQKAGRHNQVQTFLHSIRVLLQVVHCRILILKTLVFQPQSSCHFHSCSQVQMCLAPKIPHSEVLYDCRTLYAFFSSNSQKSFISQLCSDSTFQQKKSAKIVFLAKAQCIVSDRMCFIDIR